MFYSTNVGIWLVFCKEIWIRQQHSKSCHKVCQMWLLMLVQFPYNLFKIISAVMLVIYIKAISVTTEWKKKERKHKKQPSLGNLFPKVFYFLKIPGKRQSWHSSLRSQFYYLPSLLIIWNKDPNEQTLGRKKILLM